GKQVGAPVYELFGGTGTTVPVADVIGIYGVEETLERVERAAGSGAETIKLKVGTRDVGGLGGYERDVQVIRGGHQIVEGADQPVRLVADANQGFVTPERTLRIAREIEGCLAWLEQPILAGDKAGFREVKAGCDLPLMADESVHDIHDARLLLEWGAVDYLNLKLMKTGGLVETLRIADLAERHGVPCQMGSMLENQIGCAICAHTFCCHTNILTTELCSLGMLAGWIGSGIAVGEHHLELSDTPGIGIEVEPVEIVTHLVSESDSLTYDRIRNGFGIS
ncbi:MAG: enolase C-terminal domain-like protein, partial [Candidatus Latescibacteria bacterium]|nr:enolase C-terminal domain-like protein [Candidatus Latescibacterota bacterium]